MITAHEQQLLEAAEPFLNAMAKLNCQTYVAIQAPGLTIEITRRPPLLKPEPKPALPEVVVSDRTES